MGVTLGQKLSLEIRKRSSFMGYLLVLTSSKTTDIQSKVVLYGAFKVSCLPLTLAKVMLYGASALPVSSLTDEPACLWNREDGVSRLKVMVYGVFFPG